jgi:hypothetical protein
MKLRVGDRLPDASLTSPGRGTSSASWRAPSLYTVTRVVLETPWYGLYEGKKVFRNFNHRTGELEEAAEEECLDVFLKTLSYSRLDNREFIKTCRGHAWFEAKKCLGLRKTNLLPEPLDFLEVTNTQDNFTFPRAGLLTGREPVLVFAKFHGTPLARWLQDQQPSLPRILRVLAEILAFIALIHEQGLLLTGLGPVAFWIDEMDRLRYMASEMMIDARRQAARELIYPPERYLAGFSAPEASTPEALLDVRADLYSWAALAYFLLTGESPVQIARAQGRRHAHLQAGHLDHLRQRLRMLSLRDLARVNEWFQVRGPRFAQTWPECFIASLQQCLEDQPEKRPESVEKLRHGWLRPRPQPVRLAIAIRTGGGQTILLFSKHGLDVEADIVVRRGTNSMPTSPHEGQLIADGPPNGRVIDRSSPTPFSPFYAAFSRVRSDGEEMYSVATPVVVLDLAKPDQLRAYAERCAAEEAEPPALLAVNHLPAGLTLFEGLDDLTLVAENLFGSNRPLIRRWAITLVAQQIEKRGLDTKEWQLLWQRGLSDSRYDLQLATGRVMLSHTRRPPQELLLRVSALLGGPNIDDQIRALDSLRSSYQLDDDVLDKARRTLEGARVVSCPECATQLKTVDYAEHLQSRHGYLVIEGALLSYGAALKQLWDHLFTSPTVARACLLADLFTQHHGSTAAAAYAEAFQRQFQQRWPGDLARLRDSEREQRWQHLAGYLAAHEVSRHAFRLLVAVDDLHLRHFARLVFIPLVARHLGKEVSVSTLRQAVETLCPMDNLETKIAVCRQLAAMGAFSQAAVSCINEMELDREIPCPLCRVQIRRREEGHHLRAVHDIYEFRGVRRSWADTLRYLCRCLFAVDLDPSGERPVFVDVIGELRQSEFPIKPDREAAQAFLTIAGERLGADGATARLAAALAEEAATHSDSDFRSPARVAMQHAVALLPVAQAITEQLLTIDSPCAAELGLELFTMLREPPIRVVIEKVVGRLSDRAIPLDIRLDALVILLRLYHNDEDFCIRVVEWFTNALPNKLMALECLQKVEQRSGKSQVIETVYHSLSNRIKFRCPHCQIVLVTPIMREHLWTKHGLILDGLRGREPWRMIRELIDDYVRDGYQHHLQRALEVACFVDPQQGTARFNNLARERKIDDPIIRSLSPNPRLSSVSPS